jgi:AraC family transcriptional activator of mtrCDE
MPRQPGIRAPAGQSDAPGIHYNLKRTCKRHFPNEASINLSLHTLVIVPADCAVRIEVPEGRHATSVLKPTDGRIQTTEDILSSYVAEENEPEILLICGNFRASYGRAVDLFGTLSAPTVDQFETGDRRPVKSVSAIVQFMARALSPC